MGRVSRVIASVLFVAALAGPGTAFAQDPPPAGTPPARGRGAGRGIPPPPANMNQQQLQAWLDTYAVVQAQRQLVLTDEQYPNFVARLRKLQDVRRRRMVERRKLMNELQGLIQSAASPGRDENILARVRALDEGADSGAAEMRKAYQDLDAVLTPWQRGRFRLFEEQLERQKVDLIAKTKIVGGG
jgi:Spy/CpxP family protein refolding chaperone